jgi:O-antigen/teichoic acid export membrane protein
VGTVSSVLANGWAMVVAIVCTPLLLHGLGSDEFGSWALLQTFSALTGWLSLLDLGLGISTTKVVAHHVAQGEPDDANTAASTAMWLMAAAALVGCTVAAAIALGVLAVWHPSDAPNRVGLVIACFAVQSVFELISSGMSSVFEGYQRVDRSRQLDMVRRTIVLGSQTAVALAVGTLLATMATAAVASAAATLIIFVSMRRQGVRWRRFDRSASRELARYGKTVSALRPISVLQRSMDKILVAAMLGPAAVVGVELATQIQNGAHAVMTSTSYAGVAGSSYLGGRQDRKRLRRLVEVGTRWVVLATWPVAVIAMVLSRPIIGAWVGDQYLSAANLAVAALASIVVMAPLQAGANMLLGSGRAGVNLRLMTVAIVVNLGSSIALVHFYGSIGTFLGTLLTSCLIFPMFTIAIAQEIELPPLTFLRDAVLPAVAPTLVGAAAAGAVVVLTDWHDIVTVLVGGALGAAAYAGAALRWGVDRNELRLLRGSVRREPAT